MTIHVADRVFGATGGQEPVVAVVVDGGLIAAVGTSARVTAAYPGARVRRWPGLLLPGLLNADGVALLEAAYHPDPREADALGTEPLTGGDLAGLALDDVRRGGSARRGLQRMLAHGTTAVAGPFTLPEVRSAVARSGLRVRAPGRGREPSAEGPLPAPSLDPFAARPLNAVLDGELTPGAPADFAVFDVPVDELPARALRVHGAGTCVATVLGGRLVYRAR
ncbi:hypothetical protein ABZ532_17365 [Streptomyces sp. NPDC019396]|uniref:imidazolonepropionase-like domain-containing protein n=1 Tax=Streptomyces sp. NPDC019396 TaxID=3154687 RepID=UPI0033ECCE54